MNSECLNVSQNIVLPEFDKRNKDLIIILCDDVVAG